MNDAKVTYYLIYGRLVGKRVDENDIFNDFILRDGKWMPDKNIIIMDHLNGFDASEPEDSSYRYGNGSIMFEMDEISQEEAVITVNKQILDHLRSVWIDKFKTQKEKWG